MSTTPKRRFWQIHLSTALILMLTASALLWANLIPHTYDGKPDPDYISGKIYGWPVDAAWRITLYLDWGRPDPDPFRLHLQRDTFEGVAIDAAVAILILAALTVTCEWRIRRQTTPTAPAGKDSDA